MTAQLYAMFQGINFGEKMNENEIKPKVQDIKEMF